MTKPFGAYPTRGNLALALLRGISGKKDIQIQSIATYGKMMFLLRCPSFCGELSAISYRPKTGL